MPAVRALAPVRAGRQRALYAAIAVVPAAHAHDQQLQPALGLKDVRPSKQPLMVRTFLKVYMELGSSFLFLQEQIKDIIIIIVASIPSPWCILPLCTQTGHTNKSGQCPAVVDDTHIELHDAASAPSTGHAYEALSLPLLSSSHWLVDH